jgi:endonuclease/exonuclease/phosphatase family metal-dependent hydrolase
MTVPNGVEKTKTVHIFNMHLDAFKKATRSTQLTQLRQWKLGALLDANEPVILGGDLNMTKSELEPLTKPLQCLHKLECNGMSQCPHDYPMIPGTHNGIDHLLINNLFVSLDFKKYAWPCEEAENKYVSDHPGLSMEIIFKGDESLN